MERDRKVRYVSKDEVAQGIRKQFSPEYAEFPLLQMGYSPQACPKCGNGSFTTLWLAKPNDAIDGKMWAKWYFWCDKCFSGIRCPLGTWRCRLAKHKRGRVRDVRARRKRIVNGPSGSTGVIMTVRVSVYSRNSLLQLLERFARTRTLYGSNRK